MRQADKVPPFFRAELAKTAQPPGTTHRSTRPGPSPIPRSGDDRSGPGLARRPVRLLPDDAAGRVLTGAARARRNRVTAPCGSVPMPTARRCGSRRSGPRRAEVAGRSRVLARRDPQARTRRTVRSSSSPSMSRVTWPADRAGRPSDRLCGHLGRGRRATMTPGCTSGPADDLKPRSRIDSRRAKLSPRTLTTSCMAPMAARMIAASGDVAAASRRSRKSDLDRDQGNLRAKRRRRSRPGAARYGGQRGGPAPPTRAACRLILQSAEKKLETAARRSRRPAWLAAWRTSGSARSEGTRRSSGPDRQGPAKPFHAIPTGPSPWPGSAGRRKPGPNWRRSRKPTRPSASRLYLVGVVAAELGEGMREGVCGPGSGAVRTARGCRTALRRRPCLRPRLAKPIGRSDRGERAASSRTDASDLLGSGQRRRREFRPDGQRPDLDPIRDDPAFAEIMKAGHSRTPICRRLVERRVVESRRSKVLIRPSNSGRAGS